MESMTDPQNLTAQAWKNAEALVEHFEQAVRSDSPPQQLLDDLVNRLRITAGAQSVSLSVTDGDRIETLARSGVAIRNEMEGEKEGKSGTDDQRLMVDRELLSGMRLSLDMRLAEPVSLAVRGPLDELSEALLDLCGGLYLRTQVSDLRLRLHQRTDRDQLIDRLYEGLSLPESFTAIAATIAADETIDRVSLLRRKFSNLQLIASSHRGVIDRRARQVQLLERSIGEVAATQDQSSPDTPWSFDFENGQGVSGDSKTLVTYLEESGCQELHCEGTKNVVLILERFRSYEDALPLAMILDPIGPSVRLAINRAIERDDAGWTLITNRITGRMNRSTLTYGAVAVVLILLASILIRVPLQIPVTGKVVAAVSNRLYAPAEGVVDRVLVRDGELVNKGTPLIRLRSPELELQQRTLQGALATSRTRLDSLQVSRTGRRSDEDRKPSSIDQRVLEAEIEGLETQLSLIEKQQSELLIISPIDGQVNRWDLRSSLMARPVAVGQHLVNVISVSAGWKVQLDIPDKNVGYLLDQQQQQPCAVSFRLRSDATVVHTGTIEKLSDVANVDPQGKSIVLATLSFQTSDVSQIRDGATVLALVDCGDHPLGFVWFRGLIEWWRSSSWF